MRPMASWISRTSVPVTLAAVVTIAGTLLSWQASSAGRSPDGVPYPDGYRTWFHVKSMVILADHPLANPFEGIHHVYANDAALQGLRTGRYRDGAILVFDLLQANHTEGAITEGARKLIGVMVRDRERYAATGGWGFEAFEAGKPDQRLTRDGGQGCFACHRSQERQTYVFSRLRD